MGDGFMSDYGLNTKRLPDRKLASIAKRYSRKAKSQTRELDIERVLDEAKAAFHSKLANAGRQGI